MDDLNKENKKISTFIFSYFKFLRIKDWFYIVGLSYLGFFFKNEEFYILDLFFLSVISSLYLAHGYSLNSYFDLITDKIDISNRFCKNFNLKIALFISIFLYLINLSLSFFYSKLIFLLIILGSTISFLYSSSFTRFKNKFLLNIILNSTGFTILFLIGYIANKPFSILTLYLSGYIWLGIIPSQIVHLMAHKNIEKVLYFSLLSVFKLLYLSLLIWLLWSYLFFSIFLNMDIIFLFTLIFCATQVFIIEIFKYRSAPSTEKLLKLRKIFTLMDVIFGINLIYFFIKCIF